MSGFRKEVTDLVRPKLAPMDFEAAGKFNRYFYTLAETVADAPDRPNWTPGSAYAPKP